MPLVENGALELFLGEHGARLPPLQPTFLQAKVAATLDDGSAEANFLQRLGVSAASPAS